MAAATLEAASDKTIPMVLLARLEVLKARGMTATAPEPRVAGMTITE